MHRNPLIVRTQVFHVKRYFFALFLGLSLSCSMAFASPFFENGAFTQNGIEWCQENLALYEILGDKFFEHHKYSLESRVCASLYGDPLWSYEGPDKITKLIEKSRYYTNLELAESMAESKQGIIDPTPAARDLDNVFLQGTTDDGNATLQIVSGKPTKGKQVTLDLSFLDRTGHLMSNVNYDITVYQQDQLVLEKHSGFTQNGKTTLTTRPLISDDPIDISVTINGIGVSGTELKEPKGQVFMFRVVPEFSSVLSVSCIAIFASIIFSLRSKTLFDVQR